MDYATYPERHTVQVHIVPDKFTSYISDAFDYNFTGESTFTLPEYEKPPEGFNLGIIVGSSGSGKTQILRNFYNYKDTPTLWERDKAVVSHFSTPEEAVEKCFASGLASIPSLCRPYHVLSVGEAFRADIARLLQDGAIIDEFTSTVNRETAISLSCSISKYIRKKDYKNIILASCHRDILEWLEPDWVFDCDNNCLLVQTDITRSFVRRAHIEIY
jgi:hypothetical protein